MNILNHSEFDSVTMKKFAKVWMSSTQVMKAFRIFFTVFFVVIALLATVAIFFAPYLWTSSLLLYLCCLIFLGVNIVKRKRIEKVYRIRDITAIRYTFLDEEFLTEAVSEKLSSKATLPYSIIKKVFETETFLCIWCKNGAYIVKMDGFSSYNDLVDVRIKLSSLLGKNYIFHK